MDNAYFGKYVPQAKFEMMDGEYHLRGIMSGGILIYERSKNLLPIMNPQNVVAFPQNEVREELLEIAEEVRKGNLLPIEYSNPLTSIYFSKPSDVLFMGKMLNLVSDINNGSPETKMMALVTIDNIMKNVEPPVAFQRQRVQLSLLE